MNDQLAQQDFEQKVTAVVQYAMIEVGQTPRYRDAAAFIDVLRAEGYVIEPLPIRATPVPGAVVEHQDDGAEVVNMAGEIVARL